jgi:protein TonB
MANRALRELVMPPMVERRFAGLMMLSLLLHGSLFAGLAWQRQASPPALPPLQATLRLASPVEAEPPAVAVAPATVPVKVQPSPPARAPRPTPRVTTAARPTLPSAPPAPPVAVASAAAASPPAPVAVSAPALAVAAVAPPVAAPTVPTADLLAAYRRRLGELFASHHDYPRVAALRGWEGEVRLRLRVARKGTLLAVDVDHSSGFKVLDQHALAMLAELGGLPPLPEALGEHEIQVVVPINYKLNKAT